MDVKLLIKTTEVTEGLEPEDAERAQDTNTAFREHGYGGNMRDLPNLEALTSSTCNVSNFNQLLP